MAFDRKNFTGNMGVGSNAPAVFSYVGEEADLTSANLQTMDVKPGDIIMVSDVNQVNPVAVKSVDDSYALV